MSNCDPFFEDCASGGWIETHQTLAIIIGCILTLIAAFIIYKIVSYRRRPFCSVCGENRTKYTDDDNKPICYGCELERKKDAEDKIKCPVCKTLMEKHFAERDIIIDVCPNDGGVFLTGQELNAIRDKVADDQASASASNAMLMSVVAVSAINSNCSSSC